MTGVVGAALVAGAGQKDLEDRGHAVDADRLADRGRDRGPVWADADALVDRFAGLRRIGIDEISYRRGQLFLMVVIDHDTGRLVWAAPDQNKTTLQGFFDALGSERCQAITHVSADGAVWIADVVSKNCPGALRGADPFHVVQ
jgi:transposase